MDWKESIRTYVPSNEQEKKDQELILHCIELFDDILDRSNSIVHMTSSAFVVNKTRDHVLMVYHNIFDSWSWTGGHADGDDDLLAVALREAQEETGIRNISPVFPGIFSLDVLPVLSHTRRGEYVPAHLHLTAAYLLEADEAEELTVKPDENSAVKWIPIDQLKHFSSEPHMKKVYEKLLRKARILFDSNN
ncbi:MAG TPA: NUDIX hydrolase [Negativicutes bacterium]|nr:NUDIX hydrolase [Negativicutes bacterium]